MQSWFRVTNNIDVMKLMIIPLHCKGSLFAWLKMCIRRVLALVTSIHDAIVIFITLLTFCGT